MAGGCSLGAAFPPWSHELLTLRWDDLDLDDGTVTVRPKYGGTFTANGETFPLLAWTAKSRRAYRSVPIPPDTVAVLKSYRELADGSPYVFLSLSRLRRVGAKMAAGKWRVDAKLCNNTVRDFGVIHRAAGLDDPEGTIHDLRKSWCTAMAAVVPMDTLQRWAGHSSISTTVTYYCRERAEDATRARDAFRDEQPELRLVG